MADMVTNESGAGRRHKKRRGIKRSLRVDLTPMVDLAFLLIAFFMLTTVIGKSHALELDKRIAPPDPQPVSEQRVLTILLDSFNRAYTYEGLDIDKMKMISFNNADDLKEIILDKVRKVKTECGKDKKGNQYEMVCLIKLLPGSTYKNLVQVMDEMNLTHINLKSVQEPLPEEIEAIKKQPV